MQGWGSDGIQLRHLWHRPLLAGSWRAVLQADPCTYCGGQGGTVDHVVPMRRGYRCMAYREYVGSLGADNLVGACADCNSRKANQSLLHYLLDQAGQRDQASRARYRTRKRAARRARAASARRATMHPAPE